MTTNKDNWNLIGLLLLDQILIHIAFHIETIHLIWIAN